MNITNQFCFKKRHSIGIEPIFAAPKATALPIKLQMYNYYSLNKKDLIRVTRLELTKSTWKVEVIPFNYTRYKIKKLVNIKKFLILIYGER